MHCLHFPPNPSQWPPLYVAPLFSTVLCLKNSGLILPSASSPLARRSLSLNGFHLPCCHISLQDPRIGLFPDVLASYSFLVHVILHISSRRNLAHSTLLFEIINGSPLLTSKNISQSLFCGTPNTVPLVTVKRKLGKCFKLYPSWESGMPITMANTLRRSEVSQIL